MAIDGDVRRDRTAPQLLHEGHHVVSFVSAQRDLPFSVVAMAQEPGLFLEKVEWSQTGSSTPNPRTSGTRDPTPFAPSIAVPNRLRGTPARPSLAAASPAQFQDDQSPCRVRVFRQVVQRAFATSPIVRSGWSLRTPRLQIDTAEKRTRTYVCASHRIVAANLRTDSITVPTQPLGTYSTA
jgi:hypothetical protein